MTKLRGEGFGYEEGDLCGRNYCKGLIAIHPAENCSCHIAPPCGSCTAPRAFCPVCDWQEKDDRWELGVVANLKPGQQVYHSWAQRALDPTKIDYRVIPHTHFTQICEGVYPDGTTSEQVREKVDGTFGGRFESFGNGHFKFVAYTD